MLLLLDLYLLIPSVTAQSFIPTTEFVIRTGIVTNEAVAETKTQPVIVEVQWANLQHNFNIYMSFYIFHSLNRYVLFLLKDNFWFIFFKI